MSTHIEPFTLAVSDRDLDDLHARLDAVRWPDGLVADDWSRGVPLAWMRETARYWQSGYDWRAAEAAINALPQFTTVVDGQRFHFVQARADHPGGAAIVLCHGWPGSFVEFLKLVGPLNAAGHDVVIPSLPGFGLSSPLASHGWDLSRTTHAYAAIMERLGYERYGAHGSDIGAGIAGHLASYYPDRLIGVHVASERNTLSNAGVFLPLPDDLSEAERAEVDAIKAAMRESDGYSRQQGTRPQTLAYGLADSPVGQLAWIAEKFKEWTDPARALPEDAVERDHLLTNVSLYWFTNTAGSSAQFYWEAQHARGGWTAPSDVPQGWAVFDAAPIVRRVLDPTHRHRHWTDFAVGGHFPAMEQPELLAGDIVAFFATLGR